MHIKRLKNVLLIILIALILPTAVLYASGSQEDELVEAEQLIEQKKYNDAIFILTELMKNEPDRIDEIQGLLTRVRIQKEKYNERYDELIATYGGDNVEAAYPIIKDLEEMDPQPNDATRESLVLARETAGFVFNNNRWTDIMERAALSIAEGEYAQAVEIYREGFDLSRDIFNDAGYGNIVVNEVYENADSLDSLSAEFLDLYSVFLQKRDLVGQSFGERNPVGFIEAVDSFYIELLRVAEIRSELKDKSDYFLFQEDSIRRSKGDDKQVHYLVYLDRLINGRTTVDSREGITGAIELLWNELYMNLEEESVNFAEEMYNSAYILYADHDLDAAGDGFKQLVDVAQKAITTIENGEAFGSENTPLGREALLTLDEKIMISDRYFIEDIISASDSFQSIIDQRRSLDGIQELISLLVDTAEDLRAEGDEIKGELGSEKTEINGMLVDWRSRRDEISGAEAEGISFERSAAAVEIQVTELEKMSAEVLDTEIGLTALVAETELAVFDEELGFLLAGVDESEELIKGIPAAEAAEDDLEFEVTYKYPEEAVNKIIETDAALRSLIGNVELVASLIDEERVEIRTGEPVAAASAHAAELIAKGRIQLQRIITLSDKARDQIFTAEKLKQEGERRIEESKTLTTRAEFQGAKARLEDAAKKFDESLSYREDPVLRNFRDNEIPRLYEEIQAAENNLVVSQVREYLNEGKASYSQGDFAVAQSILIKAQSRWSDTNIESNSEVEYWLTLAKTALSVTSGRTIAPTDPLYAEMNQYLNQAQGDFIDAKREVSNGRTEDADIYFSSAEQSILYVQQFFPFNEEARVLNLRISQYRDPERFNELFKSDFLTARRLISTNPQKAYIDLKDLQAINSSYPGLLSAITEAEYAAGIKVRPPDPAKLRRSGELYQLAYSIVSRNIRSEFNVALSYLDEAISLNTDNLEAIRLKDRISADVGGTATVVMSNTDQQLYQEAVSEYTAGNYLKARIIVENLLKNPDNQRNTKLIELKERIERTR